MCNDPPNAGLAVGPDLNGVSDNISTVNPGIHGVNEKFKPSGKLEAIRWASTLLPPNPYV
eukprot:5481434-Karenia_brevis.AAC.1